VRLWPALGALTAPDRPGEAPSASFEDSWRASLKKRVIVIVIVLVAWAAGIEARFMHLQIVQHTWLVQQAEIRQQRSITDRAKRGEIVDRNGQILAYSVDADTVIAVPSAIKDVPGTVAALCGALADCTREFRAQLFDRLKTPKAFAFVKRQVSPDQARRIAELKLDGIGLRTETKRFYPKVELAAHVVGFVSIDNDGLAGVESAFDSKIHGIDGRSLVQVDSLGRSVQSRVEMPSTPGATVELTIDQYIQHIAERELKAGVEANNAEAGTAIVMDPQTGEVLAMASYPTFNPNSPTAGGDKERIDELRLNRAIQSVYEPGSTFKIVTASAAFEEKVFTVDEMIDTNPGVIKFPGRPPIDEAKGHNYGVISFEDVIVQSSNVGAIKIGLKVGAERMERYIRRFGFGQLLGSDLRGQSRGVVWNPTQLTDSSLASMSMGYEVSVTPLQMVTAVSSVANGGTLYEPHVVRAVVQNGVRRVRPPKALRRTTSEATAATLTSIMEQVVEGARGTGSKARVPGYQVAGKTGTAAKLVGEPGKLRYSQTDYNVSFVGFVPSRNPKLAILVVVDTPHNGSPYGGTVAAPIFQKIAAASLRHLAVAPTINPTPAIVVTAPTNVNAPIVNAPIVPIVTDASGRSLVPDVRGLNVREALRIIGRAGLAPRVSGSGVVTEQFPAAGSPLERGGWITINLKRTAPTVLPGPPR
jgi:cell division protein FtsI (penicillin-binding protein 3)